MARPRGFKRTLIINRRLQLAIMLYSVVLAVCVTVANLLIEAALLRRVGNLSQGVTFLFIMGGMFAVFSIAVIFGFGLTNRIAGPIYRLRKHMEEVIEGKTQNEVQFRQNDFFVEVLVPYNTILKKLRDLQAIK